MPVNDQHIGRIRKKRQVWYWEGGLGPTDLIGLDTGAPVLKEIGASGIAGVLLDTAGDMHAMVVKLWDDIDPLHDIGFRIIWSSAAAAVGNRTVDWILTYSAIVKQGAIVTPATALDTVIPLAVAPKGTAQAIELSGRGAIKAGTFSKSQWGNGLFPMLNLRAELDAFHADFTEDKFFLGVEVDFVPRLTRGGGAKGMTIPYV